MTYQELITKLQETRPNPEYYKILLDNLDLVILEIAKTHQPKVAKDLHIKSPAELSHTMKILKALQSLQEV